MSLFPDITPLVNQIKEFTHNQVRTNEILAEILTEIRSSKRTSMVGDQTNSQIKEILLKKHA